MRDPYVDREFIMHDDTAIYARVEEGGGKPVVLIHGWGFSHLMWDDQISYLKEHGHDVVAIDLRGFGDSGPSPTDYSYQTWASDIGEVLTQLGIQDKEVTLAGYSIGGAIAMHYVSRGVSPLVKRLELVAAAGPLMLQGPHDNYGFTPYEYRTLIRLVNAIPLPQRSIADYLREKAFKWFLERAYGLRSPPTRTWQYRWLYDMFVSASKRALIRGLQEMRDYDLTTALSDIHIKTRILHGELDRLVPPALALLQKRSIAAHLEKLIWFNRSGHGLFFEQVDELNEALESFAR